MYSNPHHIRVIQKKRQENKQGNGRGKEGKDVKRRRTSVWTGERRDTVMTKNWEKNQHLLSMGKIINKPVEYVSLSYYLASTFVNYWSLLTLT